jgi:hypothetical protein
VRGAFPQCAAGLEYPVDVCPTCDAVAPLCFAPCPLSRCPRDLITVRDVAELRAVAGKAKADERCE